MLDRSEFDDALNMFRCGMVWDGNLCSKQARDGLVGKGYAVRHSGQQALTGRGTIALFHPRFWWRLAKRAWRWRSNPLVADANRIRRAMR